MIHVSFWSLAKTLLLLAVSLSHFFSGGFWINHLPFLSDRLLPYLKSLFARRYRKIHLQNLWAELSRKIVAMRQRCFRTHIVSYVNSYQLPSGVFRCGMLRRCLNSEDFCLVLRSLNSPFQKLGSCPAMQSSENSVFRFQVYPGLKDKSNIFWHLTNTWTQVPPLEAMNDPLLVANLSFFRLDLPFLSCALPLSLHHALLSAVPATPTIWNITKGGWCCSEGLHP